MYFQKSGEKYSFIYYDTSVRKNVRLRRKETPNVRSDEEAAQFCRKWESQQDAAKMRILRKLEWRERFHSFSILIDVYEKVRKQEAPNSWSGDRYWLHYYVLPFFLQTKNCNNMHYWPHYFEEFRDYLLTAEPLKKKRGQTALAYSTKNNIIKALNTFLRSMHRRREVSTLEKCRYFEKSKLNRKSEECVLSEISQREIFEALLALRKDAAFFFWVSLKTGLRLNELLGLSLDDFYAGDLEHVQLKNSLKPFQLKVWGYIALQSQPFCATNIRDKAGKVARKPLKSKKSMTHADSRVIPVFDKEAFNYLAEFWNVQQLAFRLHHHGDDPKDYLLFSGLNKNIYSGALRRVQVQRKGVYLFTPHDTRHTYSTWLADQTGGNFLLCKMILGHTHLDTTLRYVHLSAQVHKNIRSKSQISAQMELVV